MTLRSKDDLPLEQLPDPDMLKGRQLLEALAKPQLSPLDAAVLEAVAAQEPPPMKRANYLPAPAVFNLNAACKLVNDALGDRGYGCYLVGSSLRKRDYRDVDVRYIMADADFDQLFPGIAAPYILHPLWSLMCTSISTWLRQQTGLPVDFQIQRQTQANAEYSSETGHGREPMGFFLHPNPADQ